MTGAANAGQGIRLAKRVAALAGCSRREAEQLIEQGAVRVDGVVVQVPQQRVQPQQQVELAAGAQPGAVVPVTLLLHKPVGLPFDAPLERLLVPDQRSAGERAQRPPLQRHLAGQRCLTPLESGASGLLLFTQEPRIARKLVEDAALIEHELMVDIAGPVGPDALQRLNRPPPIDGRSRLPPKVSISRQSEGLTGLRFAVKGFQTGLIAQWCEAAGLRILAIKRIRIGRLPLAGLAPGQWRYLGPDERV